MSFPSRKSFAQLKAALLAVLLLAVSCNLQEPSVVDPLDPEPPQAADSLSISPQDISVPVGDTIRFRAPDTTVLGDTVTGRVEWTVKGGTGATIDSNGVFSSTATGDYTVQASRTGKSGRARVRVRNATAATRIAARRAALGIPPARLELHLRGHGRPRRQHHRPSQRDVDRNRRYDRHGWYYRPGSATGRSGSSRDATGRYPRRHLAGDHYRRSTNPPGGGGHARQRDPRDRRSAAVLGGRSYE